MLEEYAYNFKNTIKISNKYAKNINIVFSALSKFFKLDYNKFKFDSEKVEIYYNKKLLYTEIMRIVSDLSEMEDEYFRVLILELKYELIKNKFVKLTSKLKKVIQ